MCMHPGYFAPRPDKNNIEKWSQQSILLLFFLLPTLLVVLYVYKSNLPMYYVLFPIDVGE